MSITKGKELVVFLDYDGTLSPITDDPDQAYMSDAVSSLHRSISTTSLVVSDFMNYDY